ncbi:cysteine desulfurase [Luteimonas fraxinea]|uniref:cysteine desulfurase family protein n=1 Tax=Luteimonas fraxinea TaxID=2901869 RepID=UPI001E60D159|nr:cysteine desulfurase family protein [Luteimonas fraxinea]UHH10124.1 cysteine desulfurase [Luteimonas fraxinea]
MSAPRPLYLDHNATTPIDPRVLSAMLPYFSEQFGNPSSTEHVYGIEAAGAVETAREQVAKTLGASAGEIIFTGSCTEADNLAIVGSVRAAGGPRRLITSAIEHPAVLESFRLLENEGHQVLYLGVDETGRVRLDELESALRDTTFLVSIMGANNEVGTLQPLTEISALCAAGGALLHSDIAQMPAYCDVSVDALGLDMASLSGHKIYGPKGVGALYVRRRRPRTKLSPLTWGGGHEKGLRSATLNTPLIVGFGEAMALCAKEWRTTANHTSQITAQIRDNLTGALDGVEVNGYAERLPNNLSLSIAGVEPLALIRAMRNIVAFSASSACSTDAVKTSHVLQAMFGDIPRAQRAFRFSPGKSTPTEGIAPVVERILESVQTLRAISG